MDKNTFIISELSIDTIIVGKRLELLRKSFSLTQEQVANDLGITQIALSNYENGKVKPTLDNLLKLSEYYNASIDFIIKGNSDKGNSDKKNKEEGRIKEAKFFLFQIAKQIYQFAKNL